MKIGEMTFTYSNEAIDQMKREAKYFRDDLVSGYHSAKSRFTGMSHDEFKSEMMRLGFAPKAKAVTEFMYAKGVKISELDDGADINIQVYHANKKLLSQYVHVAERDIFMNIESRELISERALRKKMAGHLLGVSKNKDGQYIAVKSTLAAMGDIIAQYYSKSSHGAVVKNTTFKPGTSDAIVYISGIPHANTYREDKRVVYWVDGDKNSPEALFSKMREYIYAIFNDKKDADELIKFMALSSVNLDIKPNWCPIMYGDHGSGKSSILKCFVSCFEDSVSGDSPQAIILKDLDSLTEKHSEAMANKVCVCVDEILEDGMNRSAAGKKLKPLITNERVDVNPKGLKAYQIENMSRFLMCTNHPNSIPLEGGRERRYMPVLVNVTKYASEFGKWASEVTEKYPAVIGLGIKREGYRIMSEIGKSEARHYLCDRAPVSSSFDDVVAETRSNDETAFDEFIDYAGNPLYLIKSDLDEYIEKTYGSKPMSPNQYKRIRESRGYSGKVCGQFRHGNVRIRLVAKDGVDESLAIAQYKKHHDNYGKLVTDAIDTQPLNQAEQLIGLKAMMNIK